MSQERLSFKYGNFRTVVINESNPDIKTVRKLPMCDMGIDMNINEVKLYGMVNRKNGDRFSRVLPWCDFVENTNNTLIDMQKIDYDFNTGGQHFAEMSDKLLNHTFQNITGLAPFFNKNAFVDFISKYPSTEWGLILHPFTDENLTQLMYETPQLVCYDFGCCGTESMKYFENLSNALISLETEFFSNPDKKL